MKKIIIIIVLFAFNSIKSNAQVEVIAGGMAAKDFISTLKESINDVIASTDGVMTKQAFDMKQYMQLLLIQLDEVASKNINLTFDRLDKSQKELLTNINNTLRNSEELAIKVALNANDLIDNADAFAGTIPGSKKVPTVRRISPSYTLVSNANNLDINVKGQWLARKTPYFIIDGKKVTPNGYQDNSITHRFTNFIISDSTKVTNQQIELITFKRSFLSRKKKPYKFDIAFIPNLLATYNLEVVTKTQNKVEVQRTATVTHRNDHCQGERDIFLTVNARPGWKIDINSIQDIATEVRENSIYNGKRSVTENGFQCYGKVRNSGSCNWPSRDARGKVSIRANWKEYRMVDERNTIQNFLSGDLFWTDDKSIQLPSNTESFTLTVKKADGTTSVVTSNHVEKWFNVTYNNSSKQLIIHPKSAVTEL